MVTISGIVLPLTENDNPSEASIYFKYQKQQEELFIQSNTIAPLANGAFFDKPSNKLCPTPTILAFLSCQKATL